MRIDLSDQTVEAIAEIISGGSAGSSEPSIGLYRQGWKIQQFMQPFGIEVSLDGNTRVIATRSAIFEAMTRPNADVLLCKIIERVSDPRDFVHEPERLEAVLNYLNQYLVFDGLKLEIHGYRARLSEISHSASIIDSFSAAVEEIDFDTVKRDLDRALKSAESDPEDAVTAACSVIESVCRSILVELGLPLPSKKDVQGLYQAVRKPLGLSPDKDGLTDAIATDVRTILGGINTVVNGIGALRTHAGDAHGRERGYRRIDPRIARLAIHSSSSAALFLIETWKLKHPQKTLQPH